MPRRPATDSPDFPTPVSSRRIPPPEVRPPLPSSSDHSGVPIRALFTVAEALQVLGVSRQTLYRALHEDRLCAHKIRGKTVLSARLSSTSSMAWRSDVLALLKSERPLAIYKHKPPQTRACGEDLNCFGSHDLPPRSHS